MDKPGRFRRIAANLLMSAWVAPTLLFATAFLWYTSRSYPGFVMAVSLAVFWIALQLRRQRRTQPAPRREAAPKLRAPAVARK